MPKTKKIKVRANKKEDKTCATFLERLVNQPKQRNMIQDLREIHQLIYRYELMWGIALKLDFISPLPLTDINKS